MSEDTTPKKKKAPMTVMKERIAALEEENAALKEQLTASLQNTADMADSAGEEGAAALREEIRKLTAERDLQVESYHRVENENMALKRELVKINACAREPFVSPEDLAKPEAAKPPVDRAAALQRINEIEGLIAMGGLSDGERKTLKIEKRDLQLSL